MTSTRPARRDHGAAALAGATFAGWLAAVAVTAGLAKAFEWPGAWTAFAVAAGVGLFAAVVTLPLLLLVATRVRAADADALVRLSSLVLLAGVVRMAVVGAGVIIPVKLYGTATWPTFGFVAAHYTLLTLAEVGVLGRLFWRKDATSPAPPKPAPKPAVEPSDGPSDGPSDRPAVTASIR